MSLDHILNGNKEEIDSAAMEHDIKPSTIPTFNRSMSSSFNQFMMNPSINRSYTYTTPAHMRAFTTPFQTNDHHHHQDDQFNRLFNYDKDDPYNLNIMKRSLPVPLQQRSVSQVQQQQWLLRERRRSEPNQQHQQHRMDLQPERTRRHYYSSRSTDSGLGLADITARLEATLQPRDSIWTPLGDIARVPSKSPSPRLADFEEEVKLSDDHFFLSDEESAVEENLAYRMFNRSSTQDVSAKIPMPNGITDFVPRQEQEAKHGRTVSGGGGGSSWSEIVQTARARSNSCTAAGKFIR